MTVKFKVGFTISGETVFALFAKLLPIENLEVEEIAPKPTLAERAVAIHKLTHKPKLQKRKRASSGPDLKKGINGIVVTALKDNPLRAVDLQPMIKAAGYSPNSISSRLEKLRNSGVISRDSEGFWKLHAT